MTKRSCSQWIKPFCFDNLVIADRLDGKEGTKGTFYFSAQKVECPLFSALFSPAKIGATNDFRNDYTYDRLSRVTRVTQQDQSGGHIVADKRVDFGYLNDGRFDTIKRYADLAGRKKGTFYFS
jgi:hypothetical protein